MNEGRPKRPTLREVAKQAGVSTATVSLVVNGKAIDAGITENTQRLVFDAIEKLEYTPNRMASAVVTGRSRMVGVVSALSRELFETQFGTRVIKGFVRGARRLGYHFVFLEDIVTPQHDGHQSTIRAAREMCLEGLILLVDVGRGEASLDIGRWMESTLPVVSVQFTFDPDGAPGFRVNHRHAIDTYVDHLISLGHRRIAFTARHMDLNRTQAVIHLVGKALEHHGEHLDPNLVFEFPRRDKLAELAEQLESRKPTALICLYDAEAVRLMGFLQKRGLKVPEDLSIIGYGDSPLSGDVTPPLTTYRPPMEEIGEASIEYLIQCIESHSIPHMEGLRDLVGQLVIRDSTSSV